MTIFTIFAGVLILMIGLLLLFAALSALLSVIGGAQFVSSPASVFPSIATFARLSPGEHFVELGSGDGGLCLYMNDHCTGRVLGIDINPLLVLYSKWRARHLPDVTFQWADFRGVHFQSADVVYCYLLPPLLAQLMPKFEAELSRGARVISYAFPLPDRKADEVHPATPDHSALYLYQY